MFSSTKTGEDGRISAVVHILSSATKWAAIYSEQILVQKYRRKLIYSHVFCGGLLCCVRLFCCVLISCLSVKSIQLSWGHRWRWRNKRQDKCVVRMTDTVTIAKQCTQKGCLQIILGKNRKGGAACTICSSTDIYIQEYWKLEEIMLWYYSIHKRICTRLYQHGCTFNGLRDFLWAPRQRGGSRTRTGWVTLTMGPDPVRLSLLQEHIQDPAMTLHSQ